MTKSRLDAVAHSDTLLLLHDRDNSQQHYDSIYTGFCVASTSPVHLHNLDYLYKPAYTEAAFVKSHSDAFAATLSRLHQGAMDLDHRDTRSLNRSPSHTSHASTRSQQRSLSVRARSKKHGSYVSSSASSIAESDKSLTSFPSFDPESPKNDRALAALSKTDGNTHTPRKSSGLAPSIVESLIGTSPPAPGRNALFEEEPLPSQNVPGSLHLANDEHIERLMARNGPVVLIRQIAEDLAQRDAQIAALRRRAEEREMALRKLVLECGLSNLDLERRLRQIEGAAKISDDTSSIHAPLEDMISTAMKDVTEVETVDKDATLRASEARKSEAAQKGTVKGWKELLWGGTVKKPAVNGDGHKVEDVAITKPAGRKTVLQDDLFHPPDLSSAPNASRVSSAQRRPPPPERKVSASLASLALKLVAGNLGRDDSPPAVRGRASSSAETSGGRAASSASTRTTASTKAAQVKAGDSVHACRKTVAVPTATGRTGQRIPDRWDTMVSTPPGSSSGMRENFGPVEMDAILDPATQPPTITGAYNNQWNPEYLTDKFGFIYDQRRKKRQREAAESMKKMKRGGRVEMLGGSRAISPSNIDDDRSDEFLDERPDTPASNEEATPAKKWQDYLKIATFPTELLSHTPAKNASNLEVTEGESLPTSPGITTEARGFVPHASMVAQPDVSGVADNATISKPAVVSATNALNEEDLEPVRLLLAQLGEVHDALQQSRTIKWNDFQRKVRAERRREGEAAAAGTTKFRGMATMPEISLADGEMIGIAGLGLKGKVGRAKWTEFKSLVLGGIPVSIRAKIWAECSGAMAMRVPGYYDDLAARRTGEDDPAIVAQIQMDINRTLTDNIFFRRGPGVAKLEEVLLAYSRRNPDVGYCQGMNLITACLLLIMPTAEDAFWLLCSIIENILPQGYYDHSLLASRADQVVLRGYVTEILPKLSTHLDDLSIELEALTFQWFLSVFTDCLSAEALFRVWDVVLCTNDGSTFLFQVALALLKLNEKQLLKCDSPASIYTYINHQMTNHAISIDGLIHASEGLRKVVKREDVEARRAKAIEAEKVLVKQREIRNEARRKERSEKLALVNGTVASKVIEEEEADTPPISVGSEAGVISRKPSQLELAADELGELTLRTPMPVEEEAAMSLS